MFDAGVGSEVDTETVASYQLDWRSVHQMLCELARRRVALEAEEGTYLLEAEDLCVFKRLGYRTMTEYMVGELGYTRHAANERLRVSRELLALPHLAAAYRSGDLCFSKVRELTRVVTPETEVEFLATAEGKDSHQVAKLVSGLRRGDRPDAAPDPALVTRRVGFELHAEALGLLAARRAALEVELGRPANDDELVIALCQGSGPTGDVVTPPAAQQVFTTCKRCDRSAIVAGGEELAIDTATAERLACDAVLVGDTDSDERTRVTSVIPAALRRKVFVRDKFCCVVPGCTSRRYLDVHHIEHREHGGTHTMGNLCLTCFFHHQRAHDGTLEIGGTAPHRLTFAWRCRDEEDDRPSPTGN